MGYVQTQWSNLSSGESLLRASMSSIPVLGAYN